MNAFIECVKQDCKVMLRNRAQWGQPVIFFMIFIALFGIALGFDNAMLIKVAPAIIWVAFLLTSLFTIDSIFRKDMDSGILEQFVLSPHSLSGLLLAKAVALWIVSCLPLIMLLPVLGLFMQLSLIENTVLLLCVCLGSPAITLMGMLGAILTLSLPRAGIFLAILLLPLYIPILILGESSVSLLLSSNQPHFQMALLGAISLLTLSLVPFAAASALNVAMDLS